MKKTILITGSTDGIGLQTAKDLAELGHTILLHGRSAEKLTAAKQAVLAQVKDADISGYQADLSSLQQTRQMAADITADKVELDVIINNAGIFKTPEKQTAEGLDLRFAVNTIAPYLLTKALLPLLAQDGRIVNLSSAAQSSFTVDELTKPSALTDSQVYAKSKLAIAMWTVALAEEIGEKQVAVSVNPKSFIGSKMVKQAYGVAGSSLKDGSSILLKAALAEQFSQGSGKYFDNDIGQFSPGHSDLQDAALCHNLDRALALICHDYL